MPVINFSDVEVRGDFEPIPAGKYDATCYEVTEAVSKSDKPYFSWQFKIQDESYANRSLWLNTFNTPKALWKLKEVLIALGEPPSKLVGDFNVDFDRYAGRPCRVVVGFRAEGYEGRPENYVIRIEPAVVKSGNGAAPAPSSAPPSSDDDDDPFNVDFSAPEVDAREPLFG